MYIIYVMSMCPTDLFIFKPAFRKICYTPTKQF